MKKAEPFVVMAKPVGARCNLQCSYCYYSHAEKVKDFSSMAIMSDELLETFIKNYIKESTGPIVPFSWHGGEPTLAGLDFYRKAIYLQEKYLPKGWQVWNNIQTNALLLDDEWCRFLAEHHFDVGISIDGTKEFHNQYRAKGTYEKVVASIKRLQSFKLQPDLLCTVNAETMKQPLAVYRSLKSLNTGWIQFIPIVRRNDCGEVSEDSVTPEGYGEFLKMIFDEWIESDVKKLGVQLFAEMMLVYSGGSSNLCWMAPTCGRVIVLEQDGSIYSCDHYVQPEYEIGTIYDASFRSLVDGARQKRFGNQKKEALAKECKECMHLNVCNGGCPKDRFIKTDDGELRLNYLCAGLKDFFNHSSDSLKKVAQRKRII